MYRFVCGPGNSAPTECPTCGYKYHKSVEIHSCKFKDKEIKMHYRNGREAKNGDPVISLAGYGSNPINGVGVLFDAKPGNDYCNGIILPLLGGPQVTACLCDCLHIEDLMVILKEKGLDKRPAGK